MTAHAAAHENAVKMCQMHDKLTTDIEALKALQGNDQGQGERSKNTAKINTIDSTNQKARGAAEPLTE